jgi:hypothetical protein
MIMSDPAPHTRPLLPTPSGDSCRTDQDAVQTVDGPVVFCGRDNVTDMCFTALAVCGMAPGQYASSDITKPPAGGF